jgi:hypothetical protein
MIRYTLGYIIGVVWSTVAGKRLNSPAKRKTMANGSGRRLKFISEPEDRENLHKVEVQSQCSFSQGAEI